MDIINNPQLRLGRFLWQTNSRTLSYEVDDSTPETLTLTQKQYELLRCLVTASPQVLSHEQIVEKVWQSRPISLESLSQLISRTRNTLCDHDKTILVNEPGEGYKLVFTVVETISEPVQPSDADHDKTPCKNRPHHDEVTMDQEANNDKHIAQQIFIAVCSLFLGMTAYQCYQLIETVYYKQQYLSIMQAAPFPYIRKDETENALIITIDNYECHYKNGRPLLTCTKNQR